MKSINSIIKRNKFLYFPAKFLRGVFNIFLGIVVLVISLIEVPLFFITHPRIFKNDLLYVFWHWSFGHTVSDLDYTSRLYFPHRISLIYLSHPGSNRYLPLCFRHNMDVFEFRTVIPSGMGHTANHARAFMLRLPLLLLSGLWSKYHVIDYGAVRKTLSCAGNNKILIGREERDMLEPYNDLTGHMRLLRDSVGAAPKLPISLANQCRAAIRKVHQDFFEKPFIVLLLREKGSSGILDTACRSAGPHENYVKAVEFLTQNGYRVVGMGEIQHALFENMPGYYSFLGISVDKKLLNLFALMHCALYIGQQSGPYVLPNSCNVPCLISDAMPYHIGTFRSENIMLFKHLRNHATGKLLSLVEVFKHHQDLALGYHFAQKNIGIEPNTPEEIVEAVKECHAILGGQFVLSDEDRRLCEEFRKLPTKEMNIHYAANRTSLHALRQLKSELLH